MSARTASLACTSSGVGACALLAASQAERDTADSRVRMLQAVLALAQHRLAGTQAWARGQVALTCGERDSAIACVQTLEADLAHEQAAVQQMADKLAQEQAVPVVDPLVRVLVMAVLVVL